MDENGQGPQLRFHKILAVAEKALALSLNEARAKTSHPGDKGADVESESRSVFEQFLPAGFGVGEGRVYDAYGDESAQADLVITNPDHPFRYPSTKTGAYMIEGVAAVGEVKSVLDKKELKRAVDAGRRFKRLRPTFKQDDTVLGTANKALMELTDGVPPFFVLAFANKIAIETIEGILKSLVAEPVPEGKLSQFGKAPQLPIDCICVLGKGVFLNFRPGDDVPLHFEYFTGEAVEGWEWVETPAPLALTLTWLHAEMPRVERTESISLPYFAPQWAHIEYMQKQRDDQGLSQPPPRGIH